MLPQQQNDRWQTSVDDLMHIFRRALQVLSGPLDEARIPWRNPEAYDDWDNIAEVLFRSIVINSIEWSFLGREPQPLSVPRYGLRYEDYSQWSFLEVLDDGDGQGVVRVFVSYESKSSPFDSVDYCVIDESGTVIENHPAWVATPDAHFLFRHRVETARLAPIDHLSVLL